VALQTGPHEVTFRLPSTLCARLNFTLPDRALRPKLIKGEISSTTQPIVLHFEVNTEGVPTNITVVSPSGKAAEPLVV